MFACPTPKPTMQPTKTPTVEPTTDRESSTAPPGLCESSEALLCLERCASCAGCTAPPPVFPIPTPRSNLAFLRTSSHLISDYFDEEQEGIMSFSGSTRVLAGGCEDWRVDFDS